MNDLLQSMALAGAGQWSGSTDHLEAPEDLVSAGRSRRMKELAYSTTAIDYTTLSSKHKLKNKGRAGDLQDVFTLSPHRLCCLRFLWKSVSFFSSLISFLSFSLPICGVASESGSESAVLVPGICACAFIFDLIDSHFFGSCRVTRKTCSGG